MQFIHKDLGHCCGNEIVKFSLKSGANVRLMTNRDFNLYRRGGRYSYHGGVAERSPLSMKVPRAGHWHAVVDMQGLRGSTSASISLYS